MNKKKYTAQSEFNNDEFCSSKQEAEKVVLSKGYLSTEIPNKNKGTSETNILAETIIYWLHKNEKSVCVV